MPVMTVTVADKRSAFRALHQSGCFVLPNPWDVGSAQLLQAMGFKALASTSSGMAWSMGRRDNHVGVEDVLTHLARLCAATDLPVNADFEAGFADTPEGVAANVTRAVATGIAGLSIEDSTGRNAEPLYDKSLAVARIKAARTALDAAASDVLLVGRCETFLVGQPDLALAIDRLGAYAEAGADCLYAPGLRTREQIAAVVKALAPKPVNVLMGAPGLSVAELADLGVRRISTGGALARTAWAGFLRAARAIAERGSFDELGGAVSHPDINGLFPNG
jgi:methylisocitrate lyase